MLYNSFHWQGGTVRLLTMLPEYKGYNASTPFSDSNFINLMETLDSKFGRSLELKPTKHLLKNNLINRLALMKIYKLVLILIFMTLICHGMLIMKFCTILY